MYDIGNDRWYPVDSMLKPRSNTSMSAVSNRFVFIFNGLAPGTQPNSSNCIEFIDFGNFDNPAIRNAKWEGLVVSNNDFITSEPRGSASVSKSEIIIFGGASGNTFSFDFLNVISNKSTPSSKQHICKVSNLIDSPLLCDTNFCFESDFIVKTFGNYLYATDGANENLHVFSIKDKQWNFSKLNELGII